MGRSYVRFAADREAIFLKVLAQTGLVTASCQRAGVHRDTAYAHRQSDPSFAANWVAALAAFERREAGRSAEITSFADRLFARPPSPDPRR